ncbi:hypothetical protein XELAEV_18031246mg [Xenopus laevis]|uniref:Uncharacterized protein n=1 Tax=Xenopus laevis TaxID=8355 RepID=A0A974CMD9_XENLA|nr:hypothetical protein XELAEV_18031246mg [Xenopus laevis]
MAHTGRQGRAKVLLHPRQGFNQCPPPSPALPFPTLPPKIHHIALKHLCTCASSPILPHVPEPAAANPLYCLQSVPVPASAKKYTLLPPYMYLCQQQPNIHHIICLPVQVAAKILPTNMYLCQQLPKGSRGVILSGTGDL